MTDAALASVSADPDRGAPPRPFAFGASVAGASHVRAGLPCQDAFALHLEPSRVLIVVADGLGSAARAHVGARAAADAAVEAGRSHATAPPETVARAMARGARAALEHLEGERRDVACTLICVVATTHGAAAAHIGDGSAVVATPHGLLVLSEPAPSEYVNETDPLTADDWEDRLRVSTMDEPVDAIAVFTDGCQRACVGPNGEPGPGFFDPVLEYAGRCADVDEATATLSSLLESPKMAEHCDDDKTLVIAVVR